MMSGTECGGWGRVWWLWLSGTEWGRMGYLMLSRISGVELDAWGRVGCVG